MPRASLFAHLIVYAFILAGVVPALSQSCVTASQVAIAGNLRGANGIPTSNAVLTLAPSQAGFIAGCGINLPYAVTCGTSTDGSVIQTANPLTATINTTSGTGTLPSGVYFTVYEFYDALGHVTLPSPETRTTVSATGGLVINPPSTGIPSTAAGMDVFISTSSGTETLQGQTTGSASFVQSVALVTGASPATANNTVCAVTANDTIWPTGTGYIATMTDVQGNSIPGFPMQWQLNGPGTTINLSNGLPYYHGVVTYPVPILAQPQNHGQQSIAGPLSLGGYNLTNIGMLGIGTATPGWPLDVENGAINSEAGYLVNGIGGTVGQCLASDGTYYDTPVNCVTSLGTTYYQTVESAGTPLTQRPALNVTGPLTVTDSTSPARTNLALPHTGTEPEVVTATVAGSSGHCAQWNGAGGLGDSGAPCTTATLTDYYFTFTSCTITSGSNLSDCTGSQNYSSTTPTFANMPDTNYTMQCTPLNTASPASGLSFTVNSVLTTGFTYTLIEIMALGQGGGYTVTGMCHAHHN